MPIASQRYRLPTTLSNCLQIEVPTTSSSSWDLTNLLGRFTELRNILTDIYQFLKGYDKGYRWPARWGHTQGEVWESPKLLSLCHWGASPTWQVDVFTHLEASQTLYHWDFCGGFLMEALIIKSISIPSPLSTEWGDRDENSKLLTMVFRVTSSHPEAICEPTQSHLIRAKDILTTQDILRGARFPCQEPGSKIKLSEQKMFLELLSQEITRGLGVLC